MEEQNNKNTQDRKETGTQKNSTRTSLLWIFAGGYLVYTGYRLCKNVLTGAEDSSMGFMAAGIVFAVIGIVLLVMAVRNMALSEKQRLDEAEHMEKTDLSDPASESGEPEKTETVSTHKLSIAERARLAEHLAEEEKNQQ